MTPEQIKVREFHLRFHVPVGRRPSIPIPSELLFRAGLMHEELSEFLAASSKRDLLAMCDALGDLLYTLYGTAIVMGVDLEPIFNLIHNANMTKEFRTPGTPLYQKVRKGPLWKDPSPHIETILFQQGWSPIKIHFNSESVPRNLD